MLRVAAQACPCMVLSREPCRNDGFVDECYHFPLLTFFKVLYKMTTSATNNHIFHTLFPQRLVVQVMHMQMLFAPAQNALTIIMREKLLPFNLP